MKLLDQYEKFCLEWMEIGRAIARCEATRSERDVVLVKRRWIKLKGNLDQFMKKTVDGEFRDGIKQEKKNRAAGISKEEVKE